ncbi:MAG: nucleotidyltransferase family protein [Proteobacteria bacterium]|nr:nucleotidyltransferase family protein [Pseudomonadota bacterium]
MILAAGRGERMRPFTDTCPKPLLKVQGRPLIEWQLAALARGGFRRIVVNTAWLGTQIEHRIGLKPRMGADTALSISYSSEGRDFGGALETAGGIVRALPLLGEVFWVAAADVFAPAFEFTREAFDRFAASGRFAHLWLVPNPPHNARGDFGLAPDGLAQSRPSRGEAGYTFSTIALYRRALFEPPYCDIAAGNPLGIKAPLAPLLRAAMDNGQVSAELYRGAWTDVGTPERLAQLNAHGNAQDSS